MPICTPQDVISDQSTSRGVLTDSDLGPILYYHYYPLAEKEAGGDGDAGYRYGWNELGFTDGWPVVNAA